MTNRTSPSPATPSDGFSRFLDDGDNNVIDLGFPPLTNAQVIPFPGTAAAAAPPLSGRDEMADFAHEIRALGQDAEFVFDGGPGLNPLYPQGGDIDATLLDEKQRACLAAVDVLLEHRVVASEGSLSIYQNDALVKSANMMLMELASKRAITLGVRQAVQNFRKEMAHLCGKALESRKTLGELRKAIRGAYKHLEKFDLPTPREVSLLERARHGQTAFERQYHDRFVRIESGEFCLDGLEADHPEARYLAVVQADYLQLKGRFAAISQEYHRQVKDLMERLRTAFIQVGIRRRHRVLKAQYEAQLADIQAELDEIKKTQRERLQARYSMRIELLKALHLHDDIVERQRLFYTRAQIISLFLKKLRRAAIGQNLPITALEVAASTRQVTDEFWPVPPENTEKEF